MKSTCHFCYYRWFGTVTCRRFNWHSLRVKTHDTSYLPDIMTTLRIIAINVTASTLYTNVVLMAIRNFDVNCIFFSTMCNDSFFSRGIWCYGRQGMGYCDRFYFFILICEWIPIFSPRCRLTSKISVFIRWIYWQLFLGCVFPYYLTQFLYFKGKPGFLHV